MNNKLILNDLQQNHSIIAQNKILENVKNSLKSRDLLLSHDSITPNSKINKLSELNHVTSNNRIFSNEIMNNHSIKSHNSIINNSENELTLYTKNINFDSITYLNAKNNFNSVK